MFLYPFYRITVCILPSFGSLPCIDKALTGNSETCSQIMERRDAASRHMDLVVGNPLKAYILVTHNTRMVIVLHASPGLHNTLSKKKKKALHMLFKILVCLKVRHCLTVTHTFTSSLQRPADSIYDIDGTKYLWGRCHSTHRAREILPP
jgi:hypothetical protein